MAAHEDEELLGTLECLSVSQHESIKSKRKANALMPISWLPAEVVVYILEIVAFGFHRRQDLLWSWVRLTHVFYYWRAVALAQPSLWANITLGMREAPWLEAWLERSSQAPLIIRCNPQIDALSEQSPNVVSELNFVLKEWHRIRFLQVSLSHGQIAQVSWPSTGTDVLKTLDLCGEYSGDVALPPAALRNIVESTPLERLTLGRFRGLWMVWRTWSLPASLTTLKLLGHISLFSPQESCNMDQLIVILKGLPHLRTLCLHYVLPFITRSHTTQLLRIPKLQSLEIRDVAAQFISFLENLDSCAFALSRVSFVCNLRPEGIVLDPAVHRLSTFFSSARAVEAQMPLARTPLKTSLLYFHNFLGDIAFDAYFSTDLTTFDKVFGGTRPEIQNAWSFIVNSADTGARFWKRMLVIYQSIHVQSIQALGICGCPLQQDGRRSWLRFLWRELQEVRMLTFFSAGREREKDDFYTLLLTMTRGPDRRLIFPKLSHLVLQCFDFTDVEQGKRPSASICYRLAKALKKRRQMGKEIVQLRLFNCSGVEERYMQCFNEAVNHVIFVNEEA